jgi:hypothetical protein
MMASGLRTPPQGDSELTAREHAMKYGDWAGTYHSEIQQPLAPSAEPGRLPATTLTQDEGVDHPRRSLEHLPDPSLVETIGEFKNRVTKYARAGHTYTGPLPSLKLRYPPDRTKQSCYTYSDHGDIRDHRLEIQVSDMLHLPNSTTRPITDHDLTYIAGALAHTPPWSGGQFDPPDLQTLEEMMRATLDHYYLHGDKEPNYTVTRHTDNRTGRRVVIATNKPPNPWSDTYSVDVRTFRENNDPSSHSQTPSGVPFSSQRE